MNNSLTFLGGATLILLLLFGLVLFDRWQRHKGIPENNLTTLNTPGTSPRRQVMNAMLDLDDSATYDQIVTCIEHLKQMASSGMQEP